MSSGGCSGPSARASGPVASVRRLSAWCAASAALSAASAHTQSVACGKGGARSAGTGCGTDPSPPRRPGRRGEVGEGVEQAQVREQVAPHSANCPAPESEGRLRTAGCRQRMRQDAAMAICDRPGLQVHAPAAGRRSAGVRSVRVGAPSRCGRRCRGTAHARSMRPAPARPARGTAAPPSAPRSAAASRRRCRCGCVRCARRWAAISTSGTLPTMVGMPWCSLTQKRR